MDPGLPRVASCNSAINKTERNLNISYPAKLTGIGTMTDSTALSRNAGKNVNSHDSKWKKVKKVLLPSANSTAHSTTGHLPCELGSKPSSTDIRSYSPSSPSGIVNSFSTPRYLHHIYRKLSDSFAMHVVPNAYFARTFLSSRYLECWTDQMGNLIFVLTTALYKCIMSVW